MHGLISKIQKYSTKDGPGIRSTVFSIGCNLRCKCCSNPELMQAGAKVLYHAERCVACGACVALSKGTILLEDGKCIIDREACINLDECAAACNYDAYEHIGISIKAEDLAAKLLRDKVFYKQSGGGVTYSGGEAALQGDFFLSVTKLLKKEAVHVALDTAGHVPWSVLAPLAESSDLVLYDIKAFDSDLHKQIVGEDNRLILENAQKLADMKKNLIIRMILIPGINDDEKETEGRLSFVSELGSAVTRLDILKYHRLGAGKYARLGIKEPMDSIPECTDEIAMRVLKRAMDMGLNTSIGG